MLRTTYKKKALNMKLQLLQTTAAVLRLEPRSQAPEWAFQSEFCSVTKTSEELSIVCDQTKVPDSLSHEGNWSVIKVIGPLDFSLTGILASIAGPLAQASICIFAISTFDTDYILVKRDKLAHATNVLEKAGFSFPKS